MKLQNSLNVNNQYCNVSSVSLSTRKSKHLHICRLKNCNLTLQLPSFRTTPPFQNVTSLKILGITLTKNYKWNNHIENHALVLSRRQTVIKCLSSKKFCCNTCTIIYVVKSIIMTKIDYEIHLYRNAPKSSLIKLKTIYYSTIRNDFNVFRTTAINNLLYDANILPIQQGTTFATQKKNYNHNQRNSKKNT